MSENYLLLIIFLFLASCSPNWDIDSKLHSAEALMDHRPDSALIILQEIQHENIISHENRALHGLLLTQARIKNYLPIQDDSIITEAVNYFNHTSDKHRNMLAHYYLGDIKHEQQDYSSAIIHSFTAYELACELNDYFWIAMAARCIADIYHENYCVVEELEFAKIELENFTRTNKKTFINHAINDFARAYLCNENYNNAIQLSKQLLDSAQIYEDSSLRGKALNTLGLSYLALKDYNKSYYYFQLLCSSPEASAADSAYLCGIALHLEQNDEAEKIIRKLSNSKSLSETLKHWLYYQMYTSHDSLSQALEMMTAISADADKALKGSRRQNIAGSLSEHHNYKLSLNKANLKSSRLQTIIVIIIALISIISIVILAHRRYIRQQTIVDEYMIMTKDLENLLNQQSKSISYKNTLAHDLKTNESNLNLLKRHFDEFDILCKNFRRDNTNYSRKIIADCVAKIIDIFVSDEDRIKDLESYANYQYDNIMANLRRDFPKLKEEDYILFLLSQLGFSIATIALLMKKENNKTAIYNRRKRLKEKFRLFNGENRNKYLEVMEG